MVKGKWADKIKTVNNASAETSGSVKNEQLNAFIGKAVADKDLSGKMLEDEESGPIVMPVVRQPEATKKAKLVKEKRPQGRPPSGVKVIKKQFDIPEDLVEKLVILANNKYGENQTKALWAVLRGKDKLV